MKMITEKQKKFINDIKGVITEHGFSWWLCRVGSS